MYSSFIDATLLGIGVGIGAAALWGAWWLWWRLPMRQVDRLRPMIFDSAARANAEDNIRKTVGQLLGGAAVLVGAGFAYLQFSQQQQASHELLISNQVAKGFEQLGSDKEKVVVRLGGIYALEGVMNTSEQYHEPVLEALSAFVRDGTRTPTEIGDRPPATEIQAALTVIGRRRSAGPGTVDLAGEHIAKASLFNANLRALALNASHTVAVTMSASNTRCIHKRRVNRESARCPAERSPRGYSTSWHNGSPPETRVHSRPKRPVRPPIFRMRAPRHQSLTSAPCSTSPLSALSQQRPRSFSLVSPSFCSPILAKK
jgi:hypothetical protein